MVKQAKFTFHSVLFFGHTVKFVKPSSSSTQHKAKI